MILRLCAWVSVLERELEGESIDAGGGAGVPWNQSQRRRTRVSAPNGLCYSVRSAIRETTVMQVPSAA
jgi:hypothetical protein